MHAVGEHLQQRVDVGNYDVLFGFYDGSNLPEKFPRLCLFGEGNVAQSKEVGFIQKALLFHKIK